MKITKQSKQMYQKASDELSLINQTWQKADNGSVALVICQSVKECISDLLNSYLLMKNGKSSRSKSIAVLVNQCAEINEGFQKIDLRWISCKNYNPTTSAEIFCTSTQRIQVCTVIANVIKKIIDDEIKKEIQ